MKKCAKRELQNGLTVIALEESEKRLKGARRLADSGLKFSRNLRPFYRDTCATRRCIPSSGIRGNAQLLITEIHRQGSPQLHARTVRRLSTAREARFEQARSA